MNKQRFTSDRLTITESSPNGRKYLLEYQGGVNALCNRINGLFDRYKRLEEENRRLKIKNDLLSDELEQAKAVINKKWDEYLKKKELSE